jgi:DNA-binding transcriptional ArsR family regulator
MGIAATMLEALMDGRSLTASELARVAEIMPQTAGAHLARLTAAGLIRAVRQGRHRYHQLATPHVARMLEEVMRVASNARAGAAPPRHGTARRRPQGGARMLRSTWPGAWGS